MLGKAQELRSGDVLITQDGTPWDIAGVEVVREGIRLTIVDLPFVWLYGHGEMVYFTRNW